MEKGPQHRQQHGVVQPHTALLWPHLLTSNCAIENT